MELLINETAGVKFTPIDSKGQPSTVQAGSMNYSSTNESIFTVEKDAGNEFICLIKPVSVGSAQLVAEGDADLSEAIVSITKVVDVTVKPALAVGFDVDVVVNS